MEMVEVEVELHHQNPSKPNKKSLKRKGPGRPPVGGPNSAEPANCQLLIPSNCRPAILHLKNELGLRSGGEVFLWLLRQVRPDLAPTPPPPSPPKSSSKDSCPAPKALCMSAHSDDKPLAAVPRPPFRVTVVQASTLLFDTPGTLDKAERLIAAASAYGSQLVVFPEAFVGGDLNCASFDVITPLQSTEMGDEMQKWHASAIDVPGPEVDRLAKIAATYKVYLVIGVVQRSGLCLYSAFLFFDSQGQLLGQHRKNPMKSQASWSLPIYEASIGNIGGLIGEDNRFPHLRNELYAKGIGIYCAPTSDATEAWKTSMTHIAIEGGCFVLSANQFCQRSDCPLLIKDSVAPAPETLTHAGGSIIVSPSGKIIAGPNYQGECLISADIDPGETITSKFVDAGVKSTDGHNNAFPIEDGQDLSLLAEKLKAEAPANCVYDML